MNLKVGTFNILHGKDYKQYLLDKSEKINLSLTANLIRDLNLDICGLNEVRNQENVSGLVNQAKEIARELGYEYAFARAIDNRGGEYGNALVSRYPILNTRIYPIGIPVAERIAGRYYEDRCLLWAELSVNGQPLTVLVTHFGLQDDEKQAAVDLICELAPTCRTPLILMGDFNITPDTSYYQALATVLHDTVGAAEGNTLTFPSNLPTEKIDYLFTNSGCHAITARVPENVVSDHRAYVAELII